MKDAPLRTVESKKNMKNKSEIEKCINISIREKQTRLLPSVLHFVTPQAILQLKENNNEGNQVNSGQDLF